MNKRVIFAVSSMIVFGFLAYTPSLQVQAQSPLTYTGVNLAGADFGEQSLPGTFGTDYTYPTHAEVDYFVSKGMNVFRLPFRWERLQRAQFGSFDAAEQARIDDFVSYATSRGASVVLDPHNYARYYGQVIGQGVPVEAFADFWTRLANRYKNNSRVIFGLMNEPNSMPTELWRDDANRAIQAIRSTGATNLILVPGNAWTGAHSWTQSWYGTPNAVAMLAITDPLNNYAFDVHQYLDSNYSGTSEQCVSATIGAEKLVEFTNWLRQYNRRGFLGEFGGGRNETCYAALDNMLSYLDANREVWVGWTYWAAGPWWGEYIFTLEPTNCPTNCTDRPQMIPLSRHLAGVPSPIEPIRVVLSRDTTNQLRATITISNPLVNPVPGVTMTLVRASTLDGSAFVDGVPVPQSFGTINPGQSVTATVTFPGTASVPSGFSGLVRVDLSYTGGTYSETEQVITR